ncbi:MAG: hypothetical protein LUD18_12500 [Lachnospiraceae bacterium]|nr:hypothetical protein [Lachnospiraceae bacterium]
MDSDTTEITLTSVTGSYSWSGESSGTYGFGNYGGQMGGGRMGNWTDDSQMPDDGQTPDEGEEQVPEDSEDSQPANVGENGQMV